MGLRWGDVRGLSPVTTTNVLPREAEGTVTEGTGAGGSRGSEARGEATTEDGRQPQDSVALHTSRCGPSDTQSDFRPPKR